jgi:hypothetical protein
MAWGLDNKTLYVGGNFGSAGGTIARCVAQLSNGSWGTMGSGALAGGVNGTYVYDLVTKPDGRIFAVGDFDTMSGGTVNEVAEWNGVQWQPVGLGVRVKGFAPMRGPITACLSPARSSQPGRSTSPTA